MTPSGDGPDGVPGHWAARALANLEPLRDWYPALADPFEVIEVNPRHIRRRCLMHSETRRRQGSKYYDWGLVLSGDWDLQWRGTPNPSVQRGTKWDAVFARYFGGSSWEETGIVEEGIARIGRGEKVAGGLRTREDVLDRYRSLDRIFEDIRSNGFRLAHEAGGNFAHNLCVSIGRDGAFLRSQGANHRLPIAVGLSLPSIPVYVLTRHSEWQALRERLAKRAGAGGPLRGLRHPDLRDLAA